MVCMPNTRTELLKEIWSWITSIDAETPAQILWLTGVAGAGKSAVAHTVGRRCQDYGLLTSCFFFDRDIPERNNPKALFSTIARDLADQCVDFSQYIARALESKRSLAGSSIFVHFNELILRSSQYLPADKPVVLIIDALDEGYNLDVLKIFRDQVPKLPGAFRILVTSRMTKELNIFLSNKLHVHSLSINIDEPSNLTDIALYADHKLREVAEWGDLGEDWPGSLLLNRFIGAAGGLFIWVTVVTEYLRMSMDPGQELKSLIERESLGDLSAETKMVELYSTILQGCKWSDRAFVNGYSLLIGAIVAAKTPLSISALQSIHRHLTLPVRTLLQPLASLLTGLANDHTPVKFLHLSLRDFLTARAGSSLVGQQFLINEKDHSERLASLCLTMLNNDLKNCEWGIGYLADKEANGVPENGNKFIPEELWYACRFWMDHVADVECPVSNLITLLTDFLSNNVVSWIEVITSKGRYQSFSKLRAWIQVRI
jgi:hypothetical protein